MRSNRKHLGSTYRPGVYTDEDDTRPPQVRAHRASGIVRAHDPVGVQAAWYDSVRVA
jgi:hypothetical protein